MPLAKTAGFLCIFREKSVVSLSAAFFLIVFSLNP